MTDLQPLFEALLAIEAAILAITMAIVVGLTQLAQVRFSSVIIRHIFDRWTKLIALILLVCLLAIGGGVYTTFEGFFGDFTGMPEWGGVLVGLVLVGLTVAFSGLLVWHVTARLRKDRVIAALVKRAAADKDLDDVGRLVQSGVASADSYLIVEGVGLLVLGVLKSVPERVTGGTPADIVESLTTLVTEVSQLVVARDMREVEVALLTRLERAIKTAATVAAPPSSADLATLAQLHFNLVESLQMRGWYGTVDRVLPGVFSLAVVVDSLGEPWRLTNLCQGPLARLSIDIVERADLSTGLAGTVTKGLEVLARQIATFRQHQRPQTGQDRLAMGAATVERRCAALAELIARTTGALASRTPSGQFDIALPELAAFLLSQAAGTLVTDWNGEPRIEPAVLVRLLAAGKERAPSLIALPPDAPNVSLARRALVMFMVVVSAYSVAAGGVEFTVARTLLVSPAWLPHFSAAIREFGPTWAVYTDFLVECAKDVPLWIDGGDTSPLGLLDAIGSAVEQSPHTLRGIEDAVSRWDPPTSAPDNVRLEWERCKLEAAERLRAAVEADGAGLVVESCGWNDK